MYAIILSVCVRSCVCIFVCVLAFFVWVALCEFFWARVFISMCVVLSECIYMCMLVSLLLRCLRVHLMCLYICISVCILSGVRAFVCLYISASSYVCLCMWFYHYSFLYLFIFYSVVLPFVPWLLLVISPLQKSLACFTYISMPIE